MLTKQIKSILKELEKGISSMNTSDYAEVLSTLNCAERIFLAGSGRSGLAIRAFANRLMHLGKKIHVVGDITTPSIRAKDVLFIGSGSGETSGLIVNAEKAKQLDAKVILNTTNPASTLGRLADLKIVIHAASKETMEEQPKDLGQPMGSAFEQLSFLLYDAIILEWITSYDQSFENMKERHANLE